MALLAKLNETFSVIFKLRFGGSFINVRQDMCVMSVRKLGVISVASFFSAFL